MTAGMKRLLSHLVRNEVVVVPGGVRHNGNRNSLEALVRHGFALRDFDPVRRNMVYRVTPAGRDAAGVVIHQYRAGIDL